MPERGAAITDPATLRKLDQERFGLDRMLLPQPSSNIPLANAELFALPSMVPVREAFDREFDRYIARHQASLPKETIGVGAGFDFQLFDRTLLGSSDARFVLAGIVNRMDRTYVSEASCGEIRLIYRLTRTTMPQATGHTVSPRLPMTLNLVLKAKADHQVDRDGSEITCSSIASRWLAAGEMSPAGLQFAERLSGKNDPLELIDYRNIDRIETNLQIAHAPKSAVREFRTDYLLKVFRYDAQARVFTETPMENQIDRERILADDGLKREFKAWLLDPVHLAEFDRGTVLDSGKVSRQWRDCADAGRVRSVGFAAGVWPGAGGGRSLRRGRCRVCAEEGVGSRHEAAEYPLACGVRTAAERRDMRRLPPDARHRRLPFSGRRLDG